MKQRIKDWIKILNETNDEDDTSLFTILSYQLKRMKNHFKKSKAHGGNYKISYPIGKVEKLIKKVRDNSSYNKPFKELDKKYGKISLTKNPNNFSCFGRSKKILNEKEYSEDFDKAILEKANLKKKDLQDAFDIVIENHECWWD